MLSYLLHNLIKADCDCGRITSGIVIVIVIRHGDIAASITRQQQNQREIVKM